MPTVLGSATLDFTGSNPASQNTTAPANTDGALVIFGGYDFTLSSVTGGGNSPLTTLSLAQAANSDACYMAIFTAVAGTFAVDPAFSANPGEGATCIVVFLQDMHQTDPVVASGTDFNTSGYPAGDTMSIALSSEANTLGIIASAGWSGESTFINTAPSGSGQTEIVEHTYNSCTLGVGYEAGTGSTVTLTSTGQYQGAIGVVLREPSASSNIDGYSDSVLTTNGAITGSGALVGSATNALSTTGTIIGSGELTGSTTLALSVTGSLTNPGIDGYTDMQLTVAGDLVGTGELAATDASQISVSGAITVTGELASTVSGTLSVTGSILGLADIDGSSSSTLTTSSNLTYYAPNLLLSASSNGRYFVDANDNPVLIFGDTAWSIIGVLNQTDTLTYLDDRESKGINLIVVNLIENSFSPTPPENADGNVPFGVSNFTTFDTNYWAHVDWFLQQCMVRNIVVLANPCYIGFNDSEGLGAEVNAASTGDMTTYGEFLGARYKDYPNIIWCLYGDRNAYATKMDALQTGISNEDPNHLFTAHFGPNVSSTDVNPSWLTMNWIYSYETDIGFGAQYAYEEVQDGWNAEIIPALASEMFYELESGTTAETIRRQIYQSIFAGSPGHIYGHRDVWGFGYGLNQVGSWQSGLSSTGITHAGYAINFFKSMLWYNLVPEHQADINIVSSGRGTYGNENWVVVSGAADGYQAAAYRSDGSAFTVDLSFFSSEIAAYWFDPTDNSYTEVTGSPFANTGTQSFNAASDFGNNSAGNSDMVLLLQTLGEGVIDGYSYLQLITSGAILGAGELGASSSSQISQSAILEGEGELSGSTSMQISVSGDADVTADLSGTITTQITTSGALLGNGELSGTASLQSSETGDLLGSGDIAGTSFSQLSATAEGSVLAEISGSTTLQLSTSGNLFGEGELAGTVTLQETDSGSLLGEGELDGYTNLQLTVDGTVSGDSFIDSTVLLQLSTSGALLGDGELVGSVSAQSSETADLEGFGALDGYTNLQLTVAGNISSDSFIDGYTSLQILVSGTLQGSIPLSGSVSLILSESGLLLGAGELDGYTNLQLTTDGEITSDSFVDGYSESILSIIASELLGAGELLGSSGSSVSISSDLSGTAELDGYVSLQLTTSGNIEGLSFISGTSSASTSASGTLLGDGYLASGEDPTLNAFGTLLGDGYLAGEASMILSTSGDVAGSVGISGNATITLSEIATLVGEGSLDGYAAVQLIVSGVLSGSLGASSSSQLTAIGELLGDGYLSGNSFSQLTAEGRFIGPIAGNVPLSLSTIGNLEGRIDIFGETSASLSSEADLSIEIGERACETLSGAGNTSANGYIVRHDLNYLNHIVQNTFLSQPKEIIISILRDEFSRDSYYHYVSDEFGFPKVKNHKGLPLGAGYKDEEVTRIFIGESYKQNVIMYPAILVKNGSQRSVPISINRNKGTIQYDAVKIVDGYGNETVVTTPKSFLFQGAWEGTLSIDIISRDILSRDDITSFCSLLFVDVRYEELLKAGILVKGVSVGAPTEGKDRSQEVIYKNTITLDIRTEWKREIPICDLIDFINICVDFGHFVDTSFETAPNLTINTVVEVE